MKLIDIFRALGMASIAALLFTAGCNTVEGVGEDIEAVGEEIDEEAEEF